MNDASLLRALLATIAISGAPGCAANPGLDYDPQACAENAFRRRPDPALLAESAAQVKQSCGIGDSASCSILGVMYELGRGVPQNRKAAEALYRRACDAGNSRACGNLGELLLTKGERAEATSILRAACDRGEPRACMVLGRASMDAAPQVGEAMLARACERGESSACVELANRLSSTGNAADAARALSLFGAACGRGDEDGCVGLDRHTRGARPRPPERSMLATTPAVQP